MRAILKFRWLIASLVIIATAGLFIISPDLSKQAEEAGNFQLPGAADEMISVVFVLDEPVTDDKKAEISAISKEIDALGEPIEKVLDPFEDEQLEEQLVSDDQQTILMPISVAGEENDVLNVSEKIRADVLPADESVYMTGETLINHDVNRSAQEGLKRTEIITVVLIFALLLLVFRSLVTPFIPLLVVGLSYLLSQSIVAFLIEWLAFPVSNYTQIFLVVVLFGIGTDYCILLLSRYKEELQTGQSTEDAIVNTYKTAGRTLFISALAVFIGFSAIGFAEFLIFKSAVGVAVGIVVLLLVLYTVIPFFMALLKEKIFWPSKKAASHSDSKIWIAFSSVSVKRPFVSLMIVAAITVPIIVFYNNDISYDMTDEIDRSYESVKGLRAISQAFGDGDSLPVKVIMKEDSKLVKENIVPYVETISEEIQKLDSVKTVRSLTRPAGEKIEEMYVDYQLGLLADGIDEAAAGLDEIQNGLAQVHGGLRQTGNAIPSDSEASTGGQQLRQAANGIEQINEQIGEIAGGLQAGMPLEQAAGGLQLLSNELQTISEGIELAAGHIEQSGSQIGALGSGLNELSSGVGASAHGLEKISSGLIEMRDVLNEMSESESVRETGMFIPKGTLEEEQFEPVREQYAFAEETGLFFEVILEEHPYSPEAIDAVRDIKAAVERSVIGTPFENAEIAYSGVSSINADLKETTSDDFKHTVTIVLICLFVALAILFRSFIMPIYMIASLLLTYYTSIGIAELIFVHMLGYDGITWAVPFFGFVMLIALGVDYSIFLLDRFREESINGLTVHDALKTSMAKMGTVIITAAVILAGTFAAMMPSGVLSLIQIAVIVITGLLLYGLIILPLLIPAITVSFGEGAWWPFALKRSNQADYETYKQI